MKKRIISLPRAARRLVQGSCFIAFGILGTSCEKTLQESPKSVAVEVFYNTAEEVETAVNAIYPRGVMSNYIATLECQSDWLYGRGSWAPLSDYQGLNDANISRVSGFWNSFYLSIRNANLVIQNAPLGTDISPQDIDNYIAEAKFLRAFSYFQLVRSWGAIPLRTENNMTEKDLAKSTVDQVYELILTDLQQAESFLPDIPIDIGRPSKWAAKTLLADVYLTLEQYDNAASKANEVIQSARYSLVEVASKEDIQYKIFGPEILTSTEEIFYFKFSRLAGQGNYILWISNHPSTQLFSYGGAYAVHGDATNPNYINWDDADLRKQLWDKIDFGLGSNTLVSAKYVDPEAISQQGAGNDQPVYRYADVLLMYAEAAARTEGNISEPAMEALNTVRRRAYGLDPSSSSALDYTIADYSTPAFIDLIIKERGYEFIYEGKRWFELKRVGKIDEIILASKGKTIAEKHRLWPIPISEINYNKALNPATDQNPGY